MATFLFLWNPQRWNWENLSDVVRRSRQGEPVFERWSCGNRRTVPAGSRAYLVRVGTERGIIASGTTLREAYRDAHWSNEPDSETYYADIAWDTILDPSEVLPLEQLSNAGLGVPWNDLYASGVQVPDESAAALDSLWQVHLGQIGRQAIFQVGTKYSRPDIYRLLNVPPDNQGGDWNTGSHQHGQDWFIFASVGTSGRTGHDYDNHWVGDELAWRGRNGSRLSQPKTQSILNPPGLVHIFTRDDDREPFTYEGAARARDASDDENGGPVRIRWYFPNRQQPEVLPNELLESEILREGAARRIIVNAYERNPAARRRCVEHYGTICGVCGFDFHAFYGSLGEGYIHVHHLRDLATIGEEYVVDPIVDLRPVCPNCHAMLHRRIPAMTIEQLREIIEAQRGNV